MKLGIWLLTIVLISATVFCFSYKADAVIFICGEAPAGGDGGPITFQDESTTSSYTSDTTLTAPAVDVSEGDLIVVVYGSLSPSVAVSAITDDSGNSYAFSNETSEGHGGIGYAIASTGNASLDVSVEWTAGTTRRTFIVAVFEPGSGETITHEDTSLKGAAQEASPWETDSDISTTVDDSVLVAGFHANGSSSTTNHEFPSGTPATVLSSGNTVLTGMYRILTTTVTNEEAECDTDTTRDYSAMAMAFNSD